MIISELIKELNKIKKENGDIACIVKTLSHGSAPEPTIKGDKVKWVLLNP